MTLQEEPEAEAKTILLLPYPDLKLLQCSMQNNYNNSTLNCKAITSSAIIGSAIFIKISKKSLLFTP